jgi:hypothetical protein
VPQVVIWDAAYLVSLDWKIPENTDVYIPPYRIGGSNAATDYRGSPRATGDSDALAPVRQKQFLVYLMGPYRTFDVEALLPAEADVETDAPSSATWEETSGEYAEDEVLRLLQQTRDCLRDRGTGVPSLWTWRA